MNDKTRAKLGALIAFLTYLLERIQIKSQRRNAPLAFGYTEQAFLELVQHEDHKKAASLARRMKRGADGLRVFLQTRKDDENKPVFDDSALYVAVVKYGAKAKEEGILPIEDGTHTAYLFQKLNESIDALAKDILEQTDDVPVAMQMIGEFLEQV